MPDARLALPFYAPTLAERYWSEDPTAQIHTTLHGPTQRRLERLLDRHISTYDANINGAALVIDAQTGAVKARVGSSATSNKGPGRPST